MMIPSSLRVSRIKTYFRLFNSYYQKRSYSYEGDGKTTVSFLSREANDQLMITAFSKLGFRLNTGLFVVGPVIMFPKTVLSWNVAGDDDINEDSLSLFYHLEPAVDVLVIGLCDDNSFKDQKKFIDKFNTLRQTKLNFELLTTEKAVATYNFLCIENRFVAAALIPPLKVKAKAKDLFSDSFDNVLTKGKDDYLVGDDEEEIRKLEEKLAKPLNPPASEKKDS